MADQIFQTWLVADEQGSYRGVCSCGWRAPFPDTAEAARDVAEAHYLTHPQPIDLGQAAAQLVGDWRRPEDGPTITTQLGRIADALEELASMAAAGGLQVRIGGKVWTAVDRP